MSKSDSQYYENPVLNFLRKEVLPTPFCPGCGNGIIASAFIRAVMELGYKDFSNFVFVSGIGCGAWIVSPHFKADSVHVAHGRAIPVAIGIKLAKPHLKVVVISGDGDLANIGGNHLIHAARRNIDMTVILVNNMNFGMTGGQTSSMTPYGLTTITAPFGNPEHPFDISELVYSAGAVFVARWTTFHVHQLKNSIKKALNTQGFAFIEVISQCPTELGRRIGMEKPSEMIQWFIKNSIPIERAKNMPSEELEGKFIIGEYPTRARPSFLKSLEVIKKKAKEHLYQIAVD